MAIVWVFLQVLLITLVVVNGEQCLPAGVTSCQVSNGCLNTQCSLNTGPGTALASIQSTCEDPVVIYFSVRNSSYFLPDYKFFVASSQQSMTDNVNGVMVIASYGRNATHLNFSVSLQIEGDIMVWLIPFMTIPINPASCMCQTTRTIPQYIGTPPLLQSYLRYNCTADPSCLGVRCSTTITDTQPFSSELYIEPCSEEMRMSVNDSSGHSIFNRTFARTEDIPIPITYAGFSIDATISIDITNFNFSMDIEVNISAPLLAPSPGVPILKRQKIILDRSRCSNPTFYPGTSPSYQIIPYSGTIPPPITKPSVKPPKTEPHSGSLRKSTIIAIAVAVPISTIFGLLVVGLVIAVVFLLYRQRKTSGFHFQRMQFQQVNENEDDD